ncbi:MAG: energy transducer TonB [Burkholderiales bacterium]
MDENERKPAWMRWGGVALALAVAVLIALWLKDQLTPKGVEKMKVQQITLVKPPPPPPPPPPPEQKPPEPEIKEEVKMNEPDPTPEPQPAEVAPAPLNVGEGAEGGLDVGGTRGTPTLAGSGGGRGNPWAWYDALLNEAVNDAFQRALARNEALKNKSYKVVVKIWLDGAGRVIRATLVDSTGDIRADEVLKDALRDMRALREGPPAEMPQPVKIRVTSRA